VKRRVYAIGDIHGRLDLLEAALERIAAHDEPDTARTVICLGDYVDRGPDSAGVVARLMALEDDGFVCLKGNHEAIMVEALGASGEEMDFWLNVGGMETLNSYGPSRAVPPEQVRWLDGLPLWWSDGNRYYVHAGLEPNVPIKEQDEAVLLWIRDKFLLAPAEALPGHVVHGHTPRWRGKPDAAVPELLGQRTNLDTGAWLTGVLSVGVFDPDAAGGPLEVLAVRER
jgi:serine/threonine protein phosphatase 1